MFCYPNPIDIRAQIIPTTPQLSYLSAQPSSPPVARLLILHGYGDHAGRHSHFMLWMADRGIACYALDFRGHGRSGGGIGVIDRWDDFLSDLTSVLAIEDLRDNRVPLFVLGHSHGGLVAAVAAMRGMLNHARGIILVAPYLQLKMPVPAVKRIFAAVASRVYPNLAVKSGITGLELTRDEKLRAEGKSDPYIRGIATPRWFTETCRVQTEVRLQPESFKLPLLMLVPGDDQVADASASVAFFNRSGSGDKTIKHYPDHRHELLRELGRLFIYTDIVAWVEARIATTNAPTPAAIA